MKVRVDMSRCQAYGTCADEAPAVFTLDEWGYAQAVDDELPPEQEAAARRAAAACPARAIALQE
ncbi:ferredoxin [Streptomyces sp. NPDC059460]|uniref:ferredoxin n=1 Tax=Streptomyces sp. NPDC059460 TaxID=3346840 RepID=UPI0036B58ED3